MANAALRQEVGKLREYMKELSYQAMRTEMAGQAVRGEARVQGRNIGPDRQRMNKQWGNLANRLGTLAEEIVTQSLPIVESPPRSSAATHRSFSPCAWFGAAGGDAGIRRHSRAQRRNPDRRNQVPPPGDPLERRPGQAGRGAVVSTLSTRTNDRSGYGPGLYPDTGAARRPKRKGVLVMDMGEEAMKVLDSGAHRHEQEKDGGEEPD